MDLQLQPSEQYQNSIIYVFAPPKFATQEQM